MAFFREKKKLNALLAAVETGDIDNVRVLLDVGVNVNAKAHNGTTALQVAKDHDYTEIMDMLKKAGAREELHFISSWK